MRLIAHRGNLAGPKPSLENNPTYLREAEARGFEVEVDLWYVDGTFYYGHDAPNRDWPAAVADLQSDRRWCHAKSIDTIEALLRIDAWMINSFFHSDDDATITTKGFLWTLPGRQLTKRSICVMPEHNHAWANDCLPIMGSLWDGLIAPIVATGCAGICTDYPLWCRSYLSSKAIQS